MIPLALKLAYTVLAVIVVVVYWRHYGWTNFLWFSDIALIATVFALWLENSLIASTMLLVVLLPEIVWNVAYFGRLVTGADFGGIAGYMFDPSRPRYLRALSLFHVVLPIVLLWTVWRLGYDARALIAASLLCWVVLPASLLATTAADNLNWVLGPGKPQTVMHRGAYLLLLMIAVPAALYVPTHLIIQQLI